MPPHLRVLASTSTASAALTDITHLVNTGQPHALVSERFEGEVVAYIKGFAPAGEHEHASGKEYFEREDRRGVTWSIQVRGRFLHPVSTDDVLFGNTFDRPLNLPWGSGAALKFMNYIDPTLEHDLTSSGKPWALSPLISTMPHFAHTRLPPANEHETEGAHNRTQNGNGNGNGRQQHLAPPSTNGARKRKTESESELGLPPFPPRESIADDTAQLHLALTDSDSDLSSGGSASDASSVEDGAGRARRRRNGNGRRGRSKGGGLGLENAGARRAYFSTPAHRQGVTFGPQDVITTDFCYGFLEFSPTLSLRLPGGITFDLMRYWDGQPVRFVCCERKREGEGGEEPWGAMFWCVVIEMADDEEEGGEGET